MTTRFNCVICGRDILHDKNHKCSEQAERRYLERLRREQRRKREEPTYGE